MTLKVLVTSLTLGQGLNLRPCHLGLHGGAFCTSLFQKSYKSELKINICQSSQHLQLQVSGHGLEPQLEFSPPVLELGPLLPYSHGAEGTVVVKNPCEFPIEFYSLEFDQQYLAEEQVRGKVWSPHACSRSFTVLQCSQACAGEMEAVPRAKPGGISGLASFAGRLWRGLDGPCCWEEGMREKIGLAGESVHVMEVKKHILYVASLPYAPRSCGC